MIATKDNATYVSNITHNTSDEWTGIVFSKVPVKLTQLENVTINNDNIISTSTPISIGDKLITTPTVNELNVTDVTITHSDMYEVLNSNVLPGYSANSKIGNKIAVSLDGLVAVIANRLFANGVGKAISINRPDIDSDWVIDADISNPNNESLTYFSSSIDLSDDGLILIISSLFLGNGQGRVYSYYRTSRTSPWVLDGDTSSFTPMIEEYFGVDVKLTGDNEVFILSHGLSDIIDNRISLKVFTRPSIGGTWSIQDTTDLDIIGNNALSFNISPDKLKIAILTKYSKLIILTRLTTSLPWTIDISIGTPYLSNNYTNSTVIIYDNRNVLFMTRGDIILYTYTSNSFNVLYNVTDTTLNLYESFAKFDNGILITSELTYDIKTLNKKLNYHVTVDNHQDIIITTGDTAITNALFPIFTNTSIGQDDEFGYDLSIDGSGLNGVVSAINFDNSAGKIFNISRPTLSDNWTIGLDTVSYHYPTFGEFGKFVSLSGNGLKLTVGETYSSSTLQHAGEFHDFTRSTVTSAWVLVNSINGSSTGVDTINGSYFGYHADTTVDELNMVVSGVGHPGPYNKNGQMYFFNRISINDPWVFESDLRHNNSDQLGGINVVYKNNLETLYVYRISVTSGFNYYIRHMTRTNVSSPWTEIDVISNVSLGTTGFGRTIALANDRLTLFIGEYLFNSGQGRVHVYKRDTVSDLFVADYIIDSPSTSKNEFGVSINVEVNDSRLFISGSKYSASDSQYSGFYEYDLGSSILLYKDKDVTLDISMEDERRRAILSLNNQSRTVNIDSSTLSSITYTYNGTNINELSGIRIGDKIEVDGNDDIVTNVEFSSSYDGGPPYIYKISFLERSNIPVSFKIKQRLVEIKTVETIIETGIIKKKFTYGDCNGKYLQHRIISDSGVEILDGTEIHLNTKT